MNKQDYLALSTIKGISSSSLNQLLSAAQSNDQNALGLIHTLISEKATPKTLDQMLNWEQSTNHHLITLADTNYPTMLKHIADPPMVLFVKGNIELLKSTYHFAVVGSRRASSQGLKNSFDFSYALAQQGLSIVSGMAYGIDAQAHYAALKANAPTIAVLGTGIDKIYPKRNEKLAIALGHHGLLISEYPLGTPPHAYNFPKRNRIISGMSLGVLIIEASLRSGSLITANLALEQGRDVFAIPGNIHNHQSKGCLSLIKSGAKLVENINDIIEEFDLKMAPKPSKSVNFLTKGLENHLQNLVKCVGNEFTSVHDIMLKSKLLPQQLSCYLVDLELKGIIKSLPGGYMRI